MGIQKQNKKRSTRSPGFTLIEVVLVLAIGGLIFLLAFLAFQQVSRNRRDTQRRTDARRMLGYVEEFATNNNGVYPFFSGVDIQSDFESRTAAGDAVLKTSPFGRILADDPVFNASATGHPTYWGYVDPGGSPPAYITWGNKSPVTSKGVFKIMVGARCNGNVATPVNSPSAYAVLLGLERTGNTFCVANT